MPHNTFRNLVLLIGTNPLPNLVAADFFLENNQSLEKIWLIHSEENAVQAGTFTQCENLEKLLRQRWEGNHPALEFPMKKIAIDDVSDGELIQNEITRQVVGKWEDDSDFHLNYTGGTKALATHAYLALKRLQHRGQRPFSYLDGNNFRLILDREGVFSGAEDLRKTVHLSFKELIELHDYTRVNKNEPFSFSKEEKQTFQDWDPKNGNQLKNGFILEKNLYSSLRKTFAGQLGKGTGNTLERNWVIRKEGWTTGEKNRKNQFELDVVWMHGYHLTGISCTISTHKKDAKLKGFEIIQRCRQIGGDEARAVIAAGLGKQATRELQEELEYDTGGNKKNILALGLADLRNEQICLDALEKFIFS